MDGVYSCWIHFLVMILCIRLVEFANSQESCAVCKKADFNCKNIYPDCDSKTLISVCFDDNKYYCVEKEEKYEKCPYCQQDGISCNKLYPNCDSKALLSLCFMDNKYYCVEMQFDDENCPLCQQNGFSCENIYPNCNLKDLLSVCFKDNKHFCVEKEPPNANCERCKEAGYQCIHSYPNCSSKLTTAVCVSNGRLVCIERLPYLISSSTNYVTTTEAQIVTSPTINNTEECHFSKIGLRPPVSVTACRENCLPVDKYIDLSKIGICSQGVCCLNKVETEKCTKVRM